MKKQITNRILSIVLVLVVVLGMLPKISFTASAAESEYDGVIGELYYKVDKENNVTTIFGNGALSSTTALVNVMTSNVVIEEGVTSIGNYAFRGLSSLEKLTVKGDVTIGNYAFQGCASLETITFMGDVTSVGRNAFQGCAGLSTIYYYGTTEPSYTNTLSYITLYSFNGVSFCGLIPSNSPATEVSGWYRNMVAYSDGVTQYFTYNNYLYQVKYTNLKTVSEVGLGRDTYDRVLFYPTYSNHLRLYTSDDFEQMITTDMFPQTPGSVLNCYSSYGDMVIEISKPVVVITCIAVNDPTWNWNGTSSATATFTAKGAAVFATAEATISSENDAANTKTIYTATV
ncbi:MAG: leucine-rich repeat domain-containing protein, partial [Clostridia bacterium]|nr:leucine-rich repeat domain-containing protein [Clostridia bacterium]